MAKVGFPWSIKGIDKETREIVRKQASAADLTIGAWIDAVIINNAKNTRVSAKTHVTEFTTKTDLASETKPIDHAYDTVVLEFIKAELDASRSRLDQALRPILFALRELALRQSVISEIQLTHGENSKKYIKESKTDLANFESNDPSETKSERIALPNSNVQTENHLAASKTEEIDSESRPTPLPPKEDLGEMEFTFSEGQSEKDSPDNLSQISQREGSRNVFSPKKPNTTYRFSISKFFLMVILLVGIIGGSLAFIYEGPPAVLATQDKILARIAKHSDSVLKTLNDAYSSLQRHLNELFLMVTQLVDQADTPTLSPQSSLSNKNVKIVLDLKHKTPSAIAEVSENEVLFTANTRDTYRIVNEVERENVPPLSQTRSDKDFSEIGAKINKKISNLRNQIVTEKVSSTLNASTVPLNLQKEDQAKIDIKLFQNLSEAPKTTTKKNAYFDFLQTQAQAGDAEAQNEIALTMLQVKGSKRDHEIALNWLKASAIQGLAAAQYNLAVLYDRGLGEVKDEIRAFFWYQRAAKQSYPTAQYNLGHFFMSGRAVPLSFKQAEHWFEAASNQGIKEASFNLGVFAEKGLAGNANIKRAISFYKKAADSGSVQASKRLQSLKQPEIENRFTLEPASLLDLQIPKESNRENTITGIQEVLLQGGFYSGRIDGIAGPKTKAAIWTYQLDHDLPLTGLPSKSLLDFMENSLEFPKTS